MRQFALSLLAVMAACTIPESAHAQAGPFPTVTDQTVLWSARACYMEATWSQADCTALLHVIRKRATKAGWSFMKMLRRYSVVNWTKQRGDEVRTYTFRAQLNKSPDWNTKWQDLLQHVTRVLNDQVADPCPSANHWAAKWYTPKSAMRRVRCQVELANAFYAGRT